MHRLFWLLLGFVVLTSSAHAHPPYSLVMDERGTVYYSDLSNIWQITPDGQRRIVVPDVHAHELWLDASGALYGEDVANVGDRYRHRVWRLSPDGSLSDARPWREGHPSDHEDFAISRDARGREYVLKRASSQLVLQENSQQLNVVDLSPIGSAPERIHVSPSGVAHLTAGSSVWRWNEGTPAPVLVASDLIDRSEAFDFVQDRHALMGVWEDDRGVYVTVFSGQHVTRIADDGTRTVVARSPGNFSPTAGLTAPDQALWLLEFSSSNEVRVRRLAPDGKETVYSEGSSVDHLFRPVQWGPMPLSPPTALALLVCLGVVTALGLIHRAAKRAAG